MASSSSSPFSQESHSSAWQNLSIGVELAVVLLGQQWLALDDDDDDGGAHLFPFI